MKAKTVNHSKVKNTGILFELMVRQITTDTLSGKSDSPKSVQLMKKYFNPTTELGKELQLYRAFFETGPLTEVKAAKIVDWIVDKHSKLDERKLLREKYELVKDIKDSYGESFFNTKIPFYKIYASIYKTFLAESNDFNVSNIQEVVTSKFTLIEHLTREQKNTENASEAKMISTFRNQTEDLRLLSYKLLLDKFNQKYSNLNENQKNLLRNYINSVSNSDDFTTYVKQQVEPLREQIASLASKESNKVLKIKLNEVVSQLSNIRERKAIKDNELTAMMIAYQIAEELKIK